jgi:hypothetical protein
MTRARDVASILTAASTLATDVETAAAISAHSSATDPHGDRADTTTQISTHAALTATHGATGAIVGTTNTQTLTNKTLTTPIISSISNSGTLTLPASSDTLVGRATTDTLTNKTLTSPIINGSTAYYQTAFSIDGSAVTPKYSGGTAPASGNASSIDIYTYTIIKTAATPTYTVFGAGPIKYA